MSERMREYTEGPYVWTRTGVGFRPTDWRNGLTYRHPKYSGIVTQTTFKLWRLHIYRMTMWRSA